MKRKRNRGRKRRRDRRPNRPSHTSRVTSIAVSTMRHRQVTGWTWTQLYTVWSQLRIHYFSGGLNPRFRSANLYFLGNFFRKTNCTERVRDMFLPWIHQRIQTLLFQILHTNLLQKQARLHVQKKFKTIMSWKNYVKISPVKFRQPRTIPFSLPVKMHQSHLFTRKSIWDHEQNLRLAFLLTGSKVMMWFLCFVRPPCRVVFAHDTQMMLFVHLEVQTKHDNLISEKCSIYAVKYLELTHLKHLKLLLLSQWQVQPRTATSTSTSIRCQYRVISLTSTMRRYQMHCLRLRMMWRHILQGIPTSKVCNIRHLYLLQVSFSTVVIMLHLAVLFQH